MANTPASWRDEAFRVTQMPWQLSKVAHFVLFAGLACVARLPPLAQPLARVWVAALALGLAWAAVRLKLLRF